MTKSGILATVAILASALASHALAQEVIYNPGYCAQYYPNANCQNRGPGSPYTGSYQRQIYQDQAYRDRTWQNSYNRADDNSGFWPADVAAGVVGGAVGTAAAIASPAPCSAARTAGGISASKAAPRIAFGKGGWKGRLFPCGSDQSGS